MNDKTRIKLTGVVKNFYYFAKDYRVFQWLYNGRGHEKEFRVLKGINFEIHDGEIVGILGANGAGKSTILKIIAGIYTQTRGTVEVNGKVTSLLELGAGFNPMLTGRENIYFKGNIIGLSNEEIDAIIDDVIEFADIGDYMEMPLKSYSSGMGARLGFALAVMVDPEILIIDEVFAVGDKDFQQKSKEKTMEFFEQGKTILFVSHSESLIRTFCNRVIYLRDGFVQFDGDVEEGIAMYHADIRQKSKNYGFVYEKTQLSDEYINFIGDAGRMYEGVVFEHVDLSELEFTIYKVENESRKYHDPGFCDIKVTQLPDKKISIQVKKSDVEKWGLVGFKVKYNNVENFAYVYKGDDTIIDGDNKLLIRHLSRKFVFNYTK
ncbi:ABC transporter ATP-binding protein [Mollicutes bacterium LVI A0039]|nr:ABC transporter ATP-binding protein [Mollicutes bacterium LVI A0039]